MERKRMKTFLVRHRRTIKACAAGAIAGAITVLLIFAAIFFGYFHVQPQDAIGVTITPAEITGTKEDGSAITGFIIESEGNQYLVTDYLAPIQMVDEVQ